MAQTRLPAPAQEQAPISRSNPLQTLDELDQLDHDEQSALRLGDFAHANRILAQRLRLKEQLLWDVILDEDLAP